MCNAEKKGNATRRHGYLLLPRLEELEQEREKQYERGEMSLKVQDVCVIAQSWGGKKGRFSPNRQEVDQPRARAQGS